MDDTALLLRYIPQSRNLLLSFAVVVFQLAAPIAAPWAWSVSSPLFLVFLVLHAYMTVLGWLLIHEAIHAKLLDNRRRNDAAGRMLSILFGCPFHILKVGHMSHHKHNRSDIDTTELVPSGTRYFWLWAVGYYVRILGMLYVLEVLAPLAFYVWSRSKRALICWSSSPHLPSVLDMFTARLVRSIRLDALFSVGLIAISAWLSWPDPWPFAFVFLARAFVISMLDNAYHYGNDADDVHAANNLRAGSVLQPLLLNHNLHRLHHRYPLASWAVLPALLARDGDGFDGNLAWRALAQLRGPIRRPSGGSTATP